jgi:hypothetical protein
MSHIERLGGLIFRFILLTGLIVTSFVPVYRQVSAQGNSRTIHIVRSIFTTEYGVKDPKGLAFSTTANSFLIFGSTDTTLVTMSEDNAGILSLPEAQSDPLNVAFDKQCLWIKESPGYCI